MGIKTNIQWCDSTVSLAVGCDGCELGEHCYARTLVGRFAGKPGWPERFDRPQLYPERLEVALRWPDLTGTKRPGKPWLDGLPRVIFLNDLNDPFTKSLPEDWLVNPMHHISDSRHIYILLTKQPKRFAEFARRWEHDIGPLPRNLWGGVSVTSQETAWRIEELLKIDLTVRLVSAEPLLDPLDLWRWLPQTPADHVSSNIRSMMVAPPQVLDGVIAGGESGPNARPCNVAWLRSLRDQCREAGTPFFLKQLGAMPIDGLCEFTHEVRIPVVRDPKGGEESEWPEDLRGCREMPKGGILDDYHTSDSL